MKNKVLFLLLSLILGITFVKAYSVSDFVNVINNGDVTKAFERQLDKEGCKTTISATDRIDSLDLNYHVICVEEKEEKINGKTEKVKKQTYDVTGSIHYDLQGDLLTSSIDRTADQREADPFYERVLALSPYWGTEMSNKYKSVYSYIKKNHKNELLETFALIFDKCYMDEMGVCYSLTPGMNYDNYIAKITMNDSGANYALKYLQKEQRELNNKSMMIKAMIVAGVLVVLIVVCKSMVPDPTKKRCKY